MPPPLAPHEFTIARSGLHFGAGAFRYAWFRIVDERGDERFRAVAFKEPAYLPIETRKDPDVLGKQ